MVPNRPAMLRALLLAKQIAAKTDPGFAGVSIPIPGEAIPLARADGGQVDDTNNLNGMGLYSQAAKAAQNLSPKQTKGSVQDMLNIISTSPGVKKDEMQWSGAQDKFAGQSGITKDDLAQHFSSKIPQIHEKTFTSGPQNSNSDGPTQYDDYAIPGGHFYREVLMHLPKNDVSISDVEKEMGFTRPLTNEQQDQVIAKWRGRGPEANYNSSHWHGTPNVVAHLRMSDRHTPEGQKALHLEELQSDWGQDARKHGHGLTPEEESRYYALIAENFRLYALMKNDKLSDDEFDKLSEQRWPIVEERNKLEAKKNTGIPNAPYINKTENWTDLGLKRALTEAAQGGYDKLVYTPGDEQARRYNLSKHIARVDYDHDPRLNTHDIVAYDPQDVPIANHYDTKPEDLEQHLGKDIAQKILNGEGRLVESNERNDLDSRINTKRLTGLDTKLGGEGMRGYYDKLLPERLLKLAREHDPEAELGHHVVERAFEGEHMSLPGLTITPRMREGILKRGFKAYADGGAVEPNNQTLDSVQAPNKIDPNHLEDIIAEMKKIGAPTIRVIKHSDPHYGYLAIEGSHRLAAAKKLGIKPRYKIIKPNEALHSSELPSDLTEEFWGSKHHYEQRDDSISMKDYVIPGRALLNYAEENQGAYYYPKDFTKPREQKADGGAVNPDARGGAVDGDGDDTYPEIGSIYSTPDGFAGGGMVMDPQKAIRRAMMTAKALHRNTGGQIYPANISFEAVPGENYDPKMKQRMQALPEHHVSAITTAMQKEFIPQIMKMANAHGKVLSQLGGWMGDTNPSRAIQVNDPNKAELVAHLAGHVLRQDGMMHVSRLPHAGSVVHGQTRILLPKGTTSKDVSEIYTKIYNHMGPDSASGHSTNLAKGTMDIFHNPVDSKLTAEEHASKIDKLLGANYNTTSNEAHVSFPGSGDYTNGVSGTYRGIGSSTSSGRGLADHLQAEAKKRLEGYISTAEAQSSKKGKLNLSPSNNEGSARGTPDGFAAGGSVQSYNVGGITKNLENYQDPHREINPNWNWRSLQDVHDELGNISEIPSHVAKFGQFMDETANKASTKGLTPRDLIKAYTITRASIQRKSRPVDLVRKAGLLLPEATEKMIRPEGAFGEWLHTPHGQAYLNAAEKGEIDLEAIRNAVQIMAPFGKHTTDVPDALIWAAKNLPGREDDISRLVASAQQGESPPSEWRSAVKDVRGIGPAKAGFFASLMGRGDQPTLDARQIILNTGQPSKEAQGYISKKGGKGGIEAVDRLSARQSAMNLSAPSDVSPYYQHLAHHTIWDKASNEETAHEDLMHAMRHAADGGRIGYSGGGDAENDIANHVLSHAMRTMGFPGLGSNDEAVKEALKRVVSPFSEDPEHVKEALRIAQTFRVPSGGEIGTGSFYQNKQPIDVRDVKRTIIPIPGVTPLKPKKTSWEDALKGAKGGTLLNVAGDRMALGRLTHINGEKLAWPVDLHAGPDYMLEPNKGKVWANNAAHASSFANKIREAAEKGDVYGSFAPMGPRAVDSAHNMFDALMAQIPSSGISSEDAMAFDELIKRGFHVKGNNKDDIAKRKNAVEVLKGWPGILNAKAASEYARNIPGNHRADIVKYMEQPSWLKRGFPPVGITRVAVSSPDVQNASGNLIGHRIIKFDPDKISSDPLSFEHSTYAAPTSGNYVADVPFVQRQYAMPDVFEGMLKAPAKNGRVVHPYSMDPHGRSTARILLEQQKQLQPINDRMIESIGRGIENQSKYGLKAGGMVSNALKISKELTQKTAAKKPSRT